MNALATIVDYLSIKIKAERNQDSKGGTFSNIVNELMETTKWKEWSTYLHHPTSSVCSWLQIRQNNLLVLLIFLPI